jgi:hypothetical protein
MLIIIGGIPVMMIILAGFCGKRKSKRAFIEGMEWSPTGSLWTREMPHPRSFSDG